jgi:hypothetical protein
MRRLNDGFLLIEILISFILITGFIVICMRYQAKSLDLQAQAITTMDVVNQLEAMLDSFEKEKSELNIANRKYEASRVIEPVTRPSIQGNPPNFSIATAQHMKVMTMSITWEGQSGEQLCCLPLIFKDDDHGNF